MKFYNINQPAEKVSFRQAVLQGAASGQGLYFPEQIPALPRGFPEGAGASSLAHLAVPLLQPFVEDDLTHDELSDVCHSAFNFPVPLKQLEKQLFVLELFHGPSLAFKDVGARFLSEVLKKFSRHLRRRITVLVATSGDTGSAVAQGFHNVDGIDVVLLYPSGKVSSLQEKTLTTVGGNVQALEVEGAFDDCQKLVKQAFADDEVTSRMNLTSANSINIGRFIPQMVYYFWAWSQLAGSDNRKVVFSVPSGNYGNLSAGLMAWRMGLPVEYFVASSNVNRVFPDYLDSGEYRPRQAVRTISNAMDVGNPSNFVRIAEMFGHDPCRVRERVRYHVSDDRQTRDAISQVYREDGYVLDPHGAVGYLGCRHHLQPGETGVFLETAHPAKFKDTVDPCIEDEVALPPYLSEMMSKPGRSVPMPAHYESFRDWLLSHAD